MYIYIDVYIYAYAHMYIYISTTRAFAPVQRCSSFLAMEAIANLSWVLREHRAGSRFRPPSCPFVEPAALLLAGSQTCSLKKSDQIYAGSWRGRRCSVAQASSDHPRWCGPHPVCLWFTLALGRGSHPRQKSIFAAIFAGVSTEIHRYIMPKVWGHGGNANSGETVWRVNQRVQPKRRQPARGQTDELSLARGGEVSRACEVGCGGVWVDSNLDFRTLVTLHLLQSHEGTIG